MKKFTLENAMIKAIQEFKKSHKEGTIRNVYAWEWDGKSSTFNIEYVDKHYEYHETQITIKAE